MKPLEAMTVAQLRQYARAIGLSSVTRLGRRASLVTAIRRMQQRYPHRYPATGPVIEHRYRPAEPPHGQSGHPTGAAATSTPARAEENPAMPITVRIGYTISDRARDYIPTCDGYRPGAAQHQVSFELPDRPELAGLSAAELAEAVFVATNAPAVLARSVLGEAEVAEALYGPASNLSEQQRRHLRALSVGDTVTVAGRTLACEPVGFTDITHITGTGG